jgi:hypothetical protein
MVLLFGARSFHSAFGPYGRPAFQEGIGATQQGTYSQHGWGNGVQSYFGARRVRFSANIGESELLEGYGRQVQNTSAAGLFFSVNMVHIFVGLGRNAVVCLLKDFFPGSETQTIGWASLDASRSDNVFAVQIALLEAERLPVAG